MGVFGGGYAPYARWPALDQNGGSRSDFYDNMNGIGVLDIHGTPRRRVWTKVRVGTYPAGSTSIIADEVVDFAAGERIVFTDSSNFALYEEAVVASLSADGHTITLSAPLQYTHTSESFSQSGYTMDLRCEVALLSRNIVVQGDSQSDYIQFGAHTMMMAGAIMRVENAEYRQCGQGFNIGRYCIHFHMAGDSHLSYAKSNSIHDSFQRAVTVHGVEYVTVWNNVAKDVRGHNFFVEDGGERENVFDNNLAINVIPLATLLQSDLEAAGFWTPTVSNFWRNNVVAKGQHAGWWYNPGMNPSGPSATDSICTLYSPILEFTNNTFHHVLFGVQIYPGFYSFADPCYASSHASLGVAGQGVTVPSTLNGIISWKNFAGSGIKSLGDVQLANLQFADNFNMGLEWAVYDGVAQGRAPQVLNGLFIGGTTTLPEGAYAINLPQAEGVQVVNTTFINWGPVAAVLTCDVCWSEAEASQSGFTIRTSGIKSINSAQLIQFQYPYKDIILDQDGTLTGVVGGTLTNNYAFNVNPNCVPQGEELGYGIVCDASVRVRKVAIQYPEPQALWGISINVTSYDMSGKALGWQQLPYHQFDFSGWMIPVVTGYRYSLSWVDAVGDWFDFESIILRYSEPDVTAATTLGPQHEWVQISFPYQSTRWQFEVDYPGNGQVDPTSQLTVGDSAFVPWNNYSAAHAQSCAPTATQPFGTGCNDNVHSVYTIVLNANINSALGTVSQQVMVQGLQCPYTGCGTDVPPAVINSTLLLWSDPGTWAQFNMTIPTAGSAVTIPPTAWVVFDLVNAPAYGLITIQGRLTFADDQDLVLTATSIFVTGDFEIGNATNPHTHQATINLVGDNTSPVVLVDNSQGSTVGNKVLAVFGNCSFYGTPLVNTWLPLSTTVTPGATTLTVSGSIADWTIGSTVVLSSTEYDTRQREQVVITAIQGSTITFTPALVYRHFAGLIDYSATSTVSFAAKVGLLTRNVVIQGQMTADNLAGGWGGHIVVSEIPSKSAGATVVAGKLSLNYVQLSNMGQGYVTPAILLHYFYGADNAAAYKTTYYAQNPPSASASTVLASSITSITGCAFTALYGQGVVVQGAPNVVLNSNVIDTAYGYALRMDVAASNAIVTQNLVVNAQRSPLDIADEHHPISAIYMLTFPLIFTSNVVAGANDSALTTFFPSCSVPQTWSIEVHSASTGVWQLHEAALTCVQLSGITAWKIGHIAIYTTDSMASMWINNVVVSDSHIGTSISTFATGSYTNLVVNVTNSVFFGTTALSTCSASLNCSGVATLGDLLGVSASCASGFGNAYRHVGLTSNAYYGRVRTCALFNYGASATCDPVNQFTFACGLPLENRYGLPDTVFGSQVVKNVVFAYWVDQ